MLQSTTENTRAAGVPLNLNSEVGQRCRRAAGVGQTFLSASWGDFPAAPGRTRKSGEPAGWKACPTLFSTESQVINFGIQA